MFFLDSKAVRRSSSYPLSLGNDCLDCPSMLLQQLLPRIPVNMSKPLCGIAVCNAVLIQKSLIPSLNVQSRLDLHLHLCSFCEEKSTVCTRQSVGILRNRVFSGCEIIAFCGISITIILLIGSVSSTPILVAFALFEQFLSFRSLWYWKLGYEMKSFCWIWVWDRRRMDSDFLYSESSLYLSKLVKPFTVSVQPLYSSWREYYISSFHWNIGKISLRHCFSGASQTSMAFSITQLK